ncbi:centromere protein X isoform X1 [Gracilinanus agilis]|uniref:centromere protein X isoform X1 n=1 Tax=Gracilinanus agilis TaxID=191870 RepID=UPI001CFC58B9|nr:centromere protein X isoform X1 [Gracilinanus agilis]
MKGSRVKRKELVSKLLYFHFKDDKCKVSPDALQLMVEMLKIFVQEAAVRAIRQAQAEDQDRVDIEQFEKVLPQLGWKIRKPVWCLPGKAQGGR